jgi:hypothetical protein
MIIFVTIIIALSNTSVMRVINNSILSLWLLLLILLKLEFLFLFLLALLRFLKFSYYIVNSFIDGTMKIIITTIVTITNYTFIAIIFRDIFVFINIILNFCNY